MGLADRNLRRAANTTNDEGDFTIKKDPEKGAEREPWEYDPQPDTSYAGVQDAWRNALFDQLSDIVVGAGVQAGYDPAGIWQEYSNLFDGFLDAVDKQLFGGGYGLDIMQMEEYYRGTAEGWSKLIEFGKTWYAGQNSDLTPYINKPLRSGGGYGGGGSRALTEEEIRNQFDLDELSARADALKKGLVLEGFKDPRGVARAYVDAVVASKGMKKIDFDTFVESQVQETARFKAIFRNMPKGMNPRQYIAPLYQQALAADPNQAEERAIGAAQFGASASQFQARLNRTDAVSGSAPFINKMQSRLSELKGVMRG